MIAKKWVEELGKFLLDIGKYVVTAVVISSVLSGKTDSWQWIVAAVIFTVVMVAVGLSLINASDASQNMSAPECAQVENAPAKTVKASRAKSKSN